MECRSLLLPDSFAFQFRSSRWTRSTKADAGAIKTYLQQVGTIRTMRYMVTKEDGHARFLQEDRLPNDTSPNLIWRLQQNPGARASLAGCVCDCTDSCGPTVAASAKEARPLSPAAN
ncbi:hypothetical protein MUK42_16279 [Musa troglodytarum]|uniref:Uncharacterized protein n=1 Tax=Musa troglodytarum TaxID=320322 RepID=A0A9E7FIJ2_9LILI|nr:hypothetical protein MUK42_16279 [Musa troglodytarum]